MWASCEEAFTVERDAHWWALMAAVLLEDKIERLSCSLSCSCQWSGSHWHSGSCRHSGSHWQRSRTVGCQTKLPKVASHQRGTNWRLVKTPSPIQLRWRVTFKDSPREDARAEELPLLTWGDEELIGEPSDWSRPEARPEKEDLECPLALDPLLQEFLSGGDAPWASDGMEDDPQQTLIPEPFSLRNAEWICWHTQQLDMPAWWQELQEVPELDNIQEFARKVWASVQIPKARCHASKVENDYSTLPAPYSLDRD